MTLQDVLVTLVALVALVLVIRRLRPAAPKAPPGCASCALAQEATRVGERVIGSSDHRPSGHRVIGQSG